MAIKFTSSADSIYTDYQPKVMSYLRARVNNSHDAEDLCQDIFVKIYSKLDSFDSSKSSLSTWVFTVTRNTLTDYFRTHKQTEELPETLTSDEDILGSIISEERLEMLAKALEELPEQQRDIIVLRFYKGYTLKQISEMVGLSYEMTKVRQRDAFKAIRKKMA